MADRVKHRATCASRLVWIDEDGEAVSCGLPCDCDDPRPWTTVEQWLDEQDTPEGAAYSRPQERE